MNYSRFVDIIHEFVSVSFGNSQIENNLTRFHPCQIGDEWDCICGVNNDRLYFVYPEFAKLMLQILLGVGNQENLFQNMYLTIPFDASAQFPQHRMMRRICNYMYLLHEISEIHGYVHIDAAIPMTNFLYSIWEKRGSRFSLKAIRDVYYRHRNADCVREEILRCLLD